MSKVDCKDCKGNSLLAYVAIFVIIVSLINFGTELTGRATDTAVVNITIVAVASINFTTDFFDFGVGEVTLGSGSAKLDSNDSSSQGADGNWSYPQGNGSFTLENIGNKDALLELATGKDAATFIGGTSPAYSYSVINNEALSCPVGFQNITFGAWQPVNTTGAGTLICSNFTFADASDTLNVSIQLVVPSDSYVGTLTDTFTATATGN